MVSIRWTDARSCSGKLRIRIFHIVFSILFSSRTDKYKRYPWQGVVLARWQKKNWEERKIFLIKYGCKIEAFAIPARGITSVKYSTQRSRRDVDIRQQSYVGILTKGVERVHISNVASLNTQRPFQMTAQPSYSLFNTECPQTQLSRRGQPISTVKGGASHQVIKL